MLALTQALDKVACSNVPVLIVGEPGTGKRALAYRIHQLSPFVSEPLEEVICAAVGPGVLDSTDGNGLLALPTSGTVYLSEIADMQGAYQSKLLKTLTHRRNGSNQARIIAGTWRNLEEEVRAGRFREELYYLLSGVCLRLPPLRHRREDIPLLIEHFLERYSTLFGRSTPALSHSTSRFLVEYGWPGNVRQLEDAVKTIAAVGDERVAMVALRSSMLAQDSAHTPSLKEKARAASRQAERELILKVLARTRWNRKRAAEELRISYKALLYKLKQIGLDDYNDSPSDQEQEL